MLLLRSAVVACGRLGKSGFKFRDCDGSGGAEVVVDHCRTDPSSGYWN